MPRSCTSLITELDVRQIYAAIERLNMQRGVHLRTDRCARCARTTTVHAIGD